MNRRDGVLRREVEWTWTAGQAVRVRWTRLVSFVQRAVAANRYESMIASATRLPLTP